MLEKRDELDKALDEALASYGEPPENDWLERRILARINEQAGRGRTIKPLLAIGAGVAAILVSLFLWGAPKKAIQTLPASAAVPIAKQIASPRTGTNCVPEPVVGLVNAAELPTLSRKRRAEPKLSRFPTPSPLSTEERALLQLVTHYPEEIPREFTQFGSPITPIQITVLEIKPLRLDGT